MTFLYLQLNTTTYEKNCSYTEEVVNNIISLYRECTAVQTANTYLAQTTLDLYHTLVNIDSGDINKDMEDNGDDKLDYYSDGQWCIMQ